jgi:hypothetical protein
VFRVALVTKNKDGSFVIQGDTSKVKDNYKVKIKSIVLSGIIFDLHQLGLGGITTTNNNLAVSVCKGIMIM